MKANLCPRCGESLIKEKGLWVCHCCGATYSEEDTKSAKEAMKEVLEEAKIELLANRRRVLWQASHDAHVSDKKLKRAASDVRAIYAEDLLSRFYLAAIDEDPSELNRFLLEEPLDAFDAREVVRFCLLSLDSRNVLALNSFVSEMFEGKEADKYLKAIADEAEKIDSGVYLTSLPRDVFLAYSSKDMDEVIRIADYLESQSISCFVASRNLRHGKGAVENYQKAIYDALKHCRSLVFVSSEASRDLHCQAMEKELPFSVDNLPKQTRIQYVIEKPGRKTGDAAKTLLKNAFRDQEWCTDLEDLSERIRKSLARTDKVCFHCGEINDGEATHCHKCGYPLDKTKYEARIKEEKEKADALRRLKELEDAKKNEAAMEEKLQKLLEERLAKKEEPKAEKTPKKTEKDLEAKLQKMLEEKLREQEAAKQKEAKKAPAKAKAQKEEAASAEDYSITLTDLGKDSIVAVVKTVDSLFDLGGLVKARQFLDKLPVELATGLTFEKAKDYEARLKEVGCKCEVKSNAPAADHYPKLKPGAIISFGSFWALNRERKQYEDALIVPSRFKDVPEDQKEPIQWRVVARNGNKATVLCEKILVYTFRSGNGYRRATYDFLRTAKDEYLGDYKDAIEQLGLPDPAFIPKGGSESMDAGVFAFTNAHPDKKDNLGSIWVNEDTKDSSRGVRMRPDGSKTFEWNTGLFGVRPMAVVDLEVLEMLGADLKPDGGAKKAKPKLKFNPPAFSAAEKQLFKKYQKTWEPFYVESYGDESLGYGWYPGKKGSSSSAIVPGYGEKDGKLYKKMGNQDYEYSGMMWRVLETKNGISTCICSCAIEDAPFDERGVGVYQGSFIQKHLNEDYFHEVFPDQGKLLVPFEDGSLVRLPAENEAKKLFYYDSDFMGQYASSRRNPLEGFWIDDGKKSADGAAAIFTQARTVKHVPVGQRQKVIAVIQVNLAPLKEAWEAKKKK